MKASGFRHMFEDLYCEFNRNEYVSPDPLQFLYKYQDLCDREIVGLISSSLAYGRVTQILAGVRIVLDRIPGPFDFLMDATRESLEDALADFRHRFTTGRDLARMLYGAKLAILRHGTLQQCFLDGYRESDGTVIPALESFVRELSLDGCAAPEYLLPLPSRGSACKRLNLFLRWMVRNDEVDPGGWTKVPVSKLVVPLDTHMETICRSLGITRRKQPNMKTALDITEFFRKVAPEDPVRYDFSLTRLGILDHTDLPSFIERWRCREVA